MNEFMVTTKKIFSLQELIRLITFASGLIVLYYNLVNEIRINKVIDTSDKQIINFRLNSLETKVNIPLQRAAILPEKVELPGPLEIELNK